MITDSIANYKKYIGVHEDFEEIFAFLTNVKEGVEPGKTVFRENELWATVSVFTETGDPAQKKFEAHRKFIDIHYIVSGEEEFGYSNVDRLTTTTPYNEQGDCEMLEGEIRSIRLKKGDFCMVFPEDAHIPCMGKSESEDLVKVIAKLEVK